MVGHAVKRSCSVGWVRIANEDWHSTMIRMKHRLSAALHIVPVDTWSRQLARRQYNFAFQMLRIPNWAAAAEGVGLEAELGKATRTHGPGRPRWTADALGQLAGEVATSHLASRLSLLRKNEVVERCRAQTVPPEFDAAIQLRSSTFGHRRPT